MLAFQKFTTPSCCNTKSRCRDTHCHTSYLVWEPPPHPNTHTYMCAHAHRQSRPIRQPSVLETSVSISQKKCEPLYLYNWHERLSDFQAIIWHLRHKVRLQRVAHQVHHSLQTEQSCQWYDRGSWTQRSNKGLEKHMNWGTPKSVTNSMEQNPSTGANKNKNIISCCETSLLGVMFGVCMSCTGRKCDRTYGLQQRWWEWVNDNLYAEWPP
jgi:hypothetical protein